MATSNIFSGSSRFSADFQSIVTRSVAIASLPLRQMEQARQNLSGQSSAVSALADKVAGLQSTLRALQDGVSLKSYAASVSDGSVLKATAAEGVREGSWAMEVISLGASTTTSSAAGASPVSDPAIQGITGASQLTLSVQDLDGGGTVNILIEPEGNTLNALVEAINAEAGASVRAAIVNAGSTSNPDYRLSLQSTKLGQIALQLNDGSADLMETGTPLGYKAKYKLQGLSGEISSDTRTVTLAPGLTAELLKTSASGVYSNVSVARTTAPFTSAVQSFIAAYNDVVSAVDSHRGETTSALQGSSLLASVTSVLRKITSYSSGSGGIQTLNALGVFFDRNGKLYLESGRHAEALSGKLPALASFLGSTESSGFLKAAESALEGLSGNTDGTLRKTVADLGRSIAAQDRRIADQEERIELMRETIQKKLAAADAAISALEQQANYFTGLFAAMKSASEANR